MRPTHTHTQTDRILLRWRISGDVGFPLVINNTRLARRAAAAAVAARKISKSFVGRHVSCSEASIMLACIVVGVFWLIPGTKQTINKHVVVLVNVRRSIRAIVWPLQSVPSIVAFIEARKKTGETRKGKVNEFPPDLTSFTASRQMLEWRLGIIFP